MARAVAAAGGDAEPEARGRWSLRPDRCFGRSGGPGQELEVHLRAWGADQALCRAVAAIHPNRSEGSSQA
jgi:hypothetical protein